MAGQSYEERLSQLRLPRVRQIRGDFIESYNILIVPDTLDAGKMFHQAKGSRMRDDCFRIWGKAFR